MNRHHIARALRGLGIVLLFGALAVIHVGYMWYAIMYAGMDYHYGTLGVTCVAMGMLIMSVAVLFISEDIDAK